MENKLAYSACRYYFVSYNIIDTILSMETTETLRAKIKSLEEELKALKAGHGDQQVRTKIEKMSAEVVDSNPYR